MEIKLFDSDFNKNGYIYPREVLEKVVADQKDFYYVSRKPGPSDEVNIEDVIALIKNLKLYDNGVYGDIEILRPFVDYIFNVGGYITPSGMGQIIGSVSKREISEYTLLHFNITDSCSFKSIKSIKAYEREYRKSIKIDKYNSIWN